MRDVTDYAITNEQATVLAKTKRRKRRASWFLSGPISGDWLQRAASLSGRALHLALTIRHMANLQKRTTIFLERKWCERFGVTPRSEDRNLARLELAGLIRVERRRGRRPRVTVLDRKLVKMRINHER